MLDSHCICKTIMNIRAILYNRKTADRIEVGLSFSNRPKRFKNTPVRRQASSYHRFRDIRLQFMSVRPISENCYPYIFSLFSTDLNKALEILNNTNKTIIQKE